MPTYRFNLLYGDGESGMGWTLSGHREADSPDALFTDIIQPFNTKYMACCAESVFPVVARISDMDVYRDMFAHPTADFTTKLGVIAGSTTEISSCAFLRVYGPTNGAGSAAWRFHGISDTLVTGQSITPSVAPWPDFHDAAFSLFHIYRPTSPSGKLPIVNPPVPGLRAVLSSVLYSRRLGRPITLAGQQRAYLRTA